MVADWPTATVAQLQRDDVLLVEDGNLGESRPWPDEFVAEGVAFVRAADMDSGVVRWESESRINERARRRIVKGIGAGGDVLLSHKGTVGKVAMAPLDAPQFVCSPQTTFWRALDTAVLDRRYLHAFLRSPAFHQQLATRAGETDMAPYVSLTSQRGLSVTLPPIEIQRAIADILGTLDDKIELNRRMSETLEAIARALFKSWFVDFEPVRAKMEGGDNGLSRRFADLFPARLVGSELGEIPEGWGHGTILDQARLLSGGTPKTDVGAYWHGAIPWVSAKDVSQSPDAFLVSTERTISASGLEESATQIIPALSTVVVARGATTGRMGLLGRDMAMNQTCYALATTTETPFALHFLLLHEIDALVHAAHGSVFNAITTRTFSTAKVVVVPPPVLRLFEAHAAPILHRVLRTVEESRTLRALRDALLPKLISGEIRVKDAERVAAAAEA